MLKETWLYKGISWRVRKVLRPIKRVKNKLLKPFKKFAKFYTFKIKYPALYKKYAKDEINDKKAVFIEIRMPYITDSFELVYDKMSKLEGIDIKTHYLRMGFADRKTYDNNCKAMIKDIATAKYVFVNDSSNVIACLPMRKDTILTQLWHACGAFKKFGMSTADLIFGDDRKTLEKYPYHGNYTYVTVSSPEIVWAYEEAMSLQDKKGVVVPVGVSRTDVFYDEARKKAAYDKLYKVFPEAKGKKVILYAPTFRGRVAKATAPNMIGVRRLMDKFADEYVYITKHHPFVKKRPEMPEGCEHFAKDLTEDMSIEELLFVSDICISDYSSLVFEYSLFERPMIFFAHDLDDYYDWRGFYYDFKEFVPGPIFTETEQLVDYIENIDTAFDKQKVVDFRKKYMSACDGHVTDKIIDMIMK